MVHLPNWLPGTPAHGLTCAAFCFVKFGLFCEDDCVTTSAAVAIDEADANKETWQRLAVKIRMLSERGSRGTRDQLKHMSVPSCFRTRERCVAEA